MRSYKQRCGLAKALDLVGDRWTLLIVRELLIRTACRYTDLRAGLPGIATNLLADRLRELEEAGIVVSNLEPPPIATTLFRLTERGRDLQESLLKLGQWGAPLLGQSVKGETLQPHWLVLPLKLLLVDHTPHEPKLCIDLRMNHESIAIEVSKGKIDVRLGTSEHPTTVVTGKPEVILQLLAGRIDFAAASAAGVNFDGPPEVLRRVVPVVRADPLKNERPGTRVRRASSHARIRTPQSP
jgi:DNA-binding HxlR family transcriptional regulator